MRKIYHFLLICLFLIPGRLWGQQTTTFSTIGTGVEGEWTVTTHWLNGVFPPVIPPNNANNYDITIESSDKITRTGDLGPYTNNITLTIKSGAYLRITGKLDVHNNLKLNIETGGVLIIEGIIDLHNNGNIELNGSMQVAGVKGNNNNSLTGNGTLYLPGQGQLIGISVGNFAGVTINGFLPVELLSFTSRSSPSGINLHWVTATETNNQGFEIQRLDVASRQWELIGWKDGNYNYNGILNYHFTDVSPSPGVNYYRLRQLDFDGKYKFYGPVAAAFGGGEKDGNFSVFRYDASWHIALPGFDPCRVEVFDLTGRKIFSDQASGSLSLPVHPRPVIIRVTDQWMQSSSRIIM